MRIYTNGAIDVAEKEIRINQNNNARTFNNKRGNNNKKNFKRKF